MMMKMSDQQFGRLCGTLISLALAGDAEDMRDCIAYIENLVSLRVRNV